MRTRLPSVTFKVSSNIAVISEVFCSFPTVLKYTSAGFFAFDSSIVGNPFICCSNSFSRILEA